MHWHNTAMNALAHGEKQWFLLPPNDTCVGFTECFSRCPFSGRTRNPDPLCKCMHATPQACCTFLLTRGLTSACV